MPSYPLPSSIIPCVTVNPQTLAPLEEPPVTLEEYPTLPSAPRNASFNSKFTVTTHILPAAYPRATSAQWVPPPLNETPSQTTDRIKLDVKYLAARKEAQERGEYIGEPRGEILWNVVNRYARKTMGRSTGSSGRGLTLIMVHCIGTHKETWEPFLQRLLSVIESSRSGVNIEEIWALEMVQHGDSGLINEPVLGDIFDCHEYPRDILNFVLSYLPEDARLSVPTNLPRLSDEIVVRRKSCGFARRTVIGIGHSVGACSFVHPAVNYPNILSSLFMVESMTIPEYIKYQDVHRNFEARCLGRRHIWDTVEEAVQTLKNCTYYRSWAPRVLDIYLKYGFSVTPDGKFRLKTHPFHEAVMLFDRVLVYSTWELISRIDPRIPIHWIWGSNSQRSGGPAVQAQTSYRRAKNSSNDYFPGVGHLLTQEAPDALAESVFNVLDLRYGHRLEETKSRL